MANIQLKTFPTLSTLAADDYIYMADHSSADGERKTLLSTIKAFILGGKTVGGNGAAITIYPKYDNASSSTLSYDMVLVSDIKIEDYANNTAIGQTLELQFTGSQILSTMPTLVDNPAQYFLIDENGNQVVDENATPNNLTAEL